jgi:hypothetical protein
MGIGFPTLNSPFAHLVRRSYWSCVTDVNVTGTPGVARPDSKSVMRTKNLRSQNRRVQVELTAVTGEPRHKIRVRLASASLSEFRINGKSHAAQHPLTNRFVFVARIGQGELPFVVEEIPGAQQAYGLREYITSKRGGECRS